VQEWPRPTQEPTMRRQWQASWPRVRLHPWCRRTALPSSAPPRSGGSIMTPRGGFGRSPNYNLLAPNWPPKCISRGVFILTHTTFGASHLTTTSCNLLLFSSFCELAKLSRRPWLLGRNERSCYEYYEEFFQSLSLILSI
jgi:hypothetical protein